MPTKIIIALEKQDKPVILMIGAILVAIIGALNLIASYEVSFTAFYVLPIFITTWFAGKYFGFLTSLISCVVWFAADKANGHHYTHSFIPIWNMVIRLSFFAIITLLLSSLRKATEREAELARIDYLTGAVNSRYFYELAQLEINRLQRYKRPFTLAYIDLDNFKILNDQQGHTSGDQALKIIVEAVRNNTRKTDVIARIGGDEFVILLPETDEESAHIVLSKLQIALLTEMRRHHWPITFSTGVLTCNSTPITVKELVKRADDLMYDVKRQGKNAFKYATYTAA